MESIRTVNKPPEKGSCSVNTVQESSHSTDVKVNCSLWISDHPPLKYIVTKGEFTLYFGPSESSDDLILSHQLRGVDDEIELLVHVQDHLGDETTMSLKLKVTIE